MKKTEKIAREERLIRQDHEILDNLRSYRLSDESVMIAGEINCEIADLEKDVMKHQKVLDRLRPAV